MHFLVLLVLILYPVVTEGVILFSDQAMAAGVADAVRPMAPLLVITTAMAGPIWWWAASGTESRPCSTEIEAMAPSADMSELLDSQTQTMGAAFVDNDSDGDLDLYLLHYQSTNQYYRNDGAFFNKVAVPDSVVVDQRTTGVAFGDYDGDGVLDMFTTHRFFTANQFFKSSYREGFANISDHISALRAGQDSFSATPFDYDNDGDLDLVNSTRKCNLRRA